MLRWTTGRQGSGYEKAKIFSTPFLDCYLIRYHVGFKLPLHTDPVQGKLHYRLNILLRGEDAYVGQYLWRRRRIICFRSDLPHGTYKLTRPRLILSFGWVRKVRDD